MRRSDAKGPAVSADVFLVGKHGFRIAAELLRWNADVKPQRLTALPDITVHTKYFDCQVQLHWIKEDDDDDQQLVMRALQQQHQQPCGGVLVVDAKDAMNPLGPRRVKWHLFSQAMQFRVVMLCGCSSLSLPAKLHEAWLSESIAQGYELTFHAHDPTFSSDDGAASAVDRFEVVPLGAEKAGLLQADLEGSARLLQLIHNTPWSTEALLRHPSAESGSPAKGPIPPCIIVIAAEESLMEQFVSPFVGVLATPNKKAPELHWTHLYGTSTATLHYVSSVLFSSTLRDTVARYLPADACGILWLENLDQPHTLLSSGMIDTLRHALPLARSLPCCWVSGGENSISTVSRAVEVEQHRGVEWIQVPPYGVGAHRKTSGAHENDDDVEGGASGYHRLHEWFTLAAHHNDDSTLQRQQTPPPSSLLIVNLTTRGTLYLHHSITELMHQFTGGGTHSDMDHDMLRVPSSLPSTLTIDNGYYHCDLRMAYCGALPPAASKRRLTRVLQTFDAILFVSDVCCKTDAFLELWVPALEALHAEVEEVVGGAEDTTTASIVLPTELLWIRSSHLDLSQQKMIPAAAVLDTILERYPIEIVTDDALKDATADDGDNDSEYVIGVKRVAEALTCTNWKRLTEKSKLTAPVRSSDAGCTDAINCGPQPDGDVTSHSAADVLHETATAGCEAPRHMLVDPETLVTVAVPQLMQGVHRRGASNGADVDGVLLSWMQKMKVHGDKLRRQDRMRQALILAEALGDTTAI